MAATALADFVSYDECKTEAEALLTQAIPGVAKCVLGPELLDFCIIFAANVAYKCAVNAAVRAKEGVCLSSGR